MSLKQQELLVYAEYCGLSEFFLSESESEHGNISLVDVQTSKLYIVVDAISSRGLHRGGLFGHDESTRS